MSERLKRFECAKFILGVLVSNSRRGLKGFSLEVTSERELVDHAIGMTDNLIYSLDRTAPTTAPDIPSEEGLRRNEMAAVIMGHLMARSGDTPGENADMAIRATDILSARLYKTRPDPLSKEPKEPST